MFAKSDMLAVDLFAFFRVQSIANSVLFLVLPLFFYIPGKARRAERSGVSFSILVWLLFPNISTFNTDTVHLAIHQQQTIALLVPGPAVLVEPAHTFLKTSNEPELIPPRVLLDVLPNLLRCVMLELTITGTAKLVLTKLSTYWIAFLV